MAKVAVAKKVAIRSMKEDDLSGVLALDRKIFGRDRALTYSDPVQDYVGGEMAMSWVAEVQGKIAGFILRRIGQILDETMPDLET